MDMGRGGGLTARRHGSPPPVSSHGLHLRCGGGLLLQRVVEVGCSGGTSWRWGHPMPSPSPTMLVVASSAGGVATVDAGEGPGGRLLPVGIWLGANG